VEAVLMDNRPAQPHFRTTNPRGAVPQQLYPPGREATSSLHSMAGQTSASSTRGGYRQAILTAYFKTLKLAARPSPRQRRRREEQTSNANSADGEGMLDIESGGL